MKKLITLLAIIVISSGCSLSEDKLDGATIYTTIYPITYITEKLYGEVSEISSIYPNDADIDEYKLTDKQKKEYADGDLFVYNGLSTEKNIAKDFVNFNSNILLIDAMHSLSITNKTEELWLSPNNYLMLTNNIKDNLKEYVENPYNIEKIDENYKEISEELSFMDAELRLIGKSATNNTFVTTNDAFLFLENYGFTVISIDEDNNLSLDELNSIKNNLTNDKYLGLIVDTSDEGEFINELKSNEEVTKIEINVLYSANNDLDYFSIMNEFIFDIKSLVE